MSGLLLCCSRDGSDELFSESDLQRCAQHITPSEITANAPQTFSRGDGLRVLLVNPVGDIPVHEGSVCLGRLYEDSFAWWDAASEVPDGSYVIVRDGDRYLELVTDAVASRGLWYVLTDRSFLASTSQRALIGLLGEFHLSEDAVAWMLSSGSLGPEASWDARLRMVPADGKVILDRRAWSVRLERGEVRFRPREDDERRQAERLLEAIQETCGHLGSLEPGWLLALSGGMDSRALLLFMLRSGVSPECITWGTESALADPAGDAAIATQVAAGLGVLPHVRAPSMTPRSPRAKPSIASWSPVRAGSTTSVGTPTDCRCGAASSSPGLPVSCEATRPSAGARS